MTTHNQFPLLPGEAGSAPPSLALGENHRSKWKRVAFFCAAATTGVSGSDRRVDMGRRGSSEEQNTWDKRARFGSTRGSSGMARGEKSGLERELSLAEGSRVEQGRASYLDRVLSAKCFCWLSACLRKRKETNILLYDKFGDIFYSSSYHCEQIPRKDQNQPINKYIVLLPSCSLAY